NRTAATNLQPNGGTARAIQINGAAVSATNPLVCTANTIISFVFENNIYRVISVSALAILPTLHVTAPPNTVVTAAMGAHTLTATAGADNIAAFSLPSLGMWTISGTVSGTAYTKPLNIDSVRVFSTVLSAAHEPGQIILNTTTSDIVGVASLGLGVGQIVGAYMVGGGNGGGNGASGKTSGEGGTGGNGGRIFLGHVRITNPSLGIIIGAGGNGGAGGNNLKFDANPGGMGGDTSITGAELLTLPTGFVTTQSGSQAAGGIGGYSPSYSANNNVPGADGASPMIRPPGTLDIYGGGGGGGAAGGFQYTNGQRRGGGGGQPGSVFGGGAGGLYDGSGSYSGGQGGFNATISGAGGGGGGGSGGRDGASAGAAAGGAGAPGRVILYAVE
ncbi:MAG: hypothetical protein FWH17_06115, partial [Oscillospiraceae bacterium]|nr:hypothetical protein [Oscillospiraceae bacterium]